jgi:hypothetical protein
MVILDSDNKVPEYVKRGKRADMKKYQQSMKGKEAQKAYNESRKKPQSQILRTKLNDILPNSLSIVKAEVLTLLLSEWDSREGLSFHMDSPMANPPMCNIDRPGVLRTAYGRDYHQPCEDDALYLTRATYGTGSGSNSVATDRRKNQTKQLSCAMDKVGDGIHKNLQRRTAKYFRAMDLSEGFNSVSILLYMGSDVISKCTESTIGYHSDAEYNSKGQFSKHNSQKENTPVVVLTLGDQRTLHMKKRKVKLDGGWMPYNGNELLHDYVLQSGSIFVLDPADEIPKTRGRENQPLSQFQHGGVKLTKGLSIAIIFRTVTTTAKINVTNNKMKLGEDDDNFLRKPINVKGGTQCKPRSEHIDDAYREALGRKQEMENQLQSYVQTAKNNGTLFNYD